MSTWFQYDKLQRDRLAIRQSPLFFQTGSCWQNHKYVAYLVGEILSKFSDEVFWKSKFACPHLYSFEGLCFLYYLRMMPTIIDVTSKFISVTFHAVRLFLNLS